MMMAENSGEIEEGEIEGEEGAEKKPKPAAPGNQDEFKDMKAVFKLIERQTTLREALDGCVVFEYPTMYVVLPPS